MLFLNNSFSSYNDNDIFRLFGMFYLYKNIVDHYITKEECFICLPLNLQKLHWKIKFQRYLAKVQQKSSN